MLCAAACNAHVATDSDIEALDVYPNFETWSWLDEPHIRRQTALGHSFRVLLSEFHNTEDSRWRFRIIKEALTNHRLNLFDSVTHEVTKTGDSRTSKKDVDSIAIAAAMLGSALKGYAYPNSDVELQIMVLDNAGVDMRFLDMSAQAAIYTNLKTILLESHGVALDVPVSSENQIPDFSTVEQWKPDQTAAGHIARLFLPLAYDGTRKADAVRRNVVRWIGRMPEPELFWDQVREIHADLIAAESSHDEIAEKPHKIRWLEKNHAKINAAKHGSFDNYRLERIAFPDWIMIANLFLNRPKPYSPCSE